MAGRSPHTAAAVIVAGGSSTRMGGANDRKPFLRLAGRTVLQHVCAAFDAAPSVVEFVLVAHPDDLERVRRMAAECPELRKSRAEVAGGTERADSVRAGVLCTSFAVEVICVHDAARPLIHPELIERVVGAAAERGSALAATPVRDTIKSSADGRCAERTVDRASLWRAQTPQAFHAKLLRELVQRASREGLRPTDEAALHETYVGPVPIVRGDESNLKITRPEDLKLAAAWLAALEGSAR